MLNSVHREEDPVGSKRRVWIFINIYFGNLETINLLFITVYPYASINEYDTVARPIYWISKLAVDALNKLGIKIVKAWFPIHGCRNAPFG